MEQALEERIRSELAEGLVRETAPPGAIEIPPIPVERYVSAEFYELEQRHVWGAAWLFAGHESELTEPGAFTLFTKTTAPLVIVRGHDGVIRAFYNSCRHRGAPVVREECGTARRLTCLYHSWSYDTTGRLRAIPDDRNFVDANPDDLGLVEVRCESWDGFLFVSEDADAPPLHEYLGVLTVQMSEIDGPSLRVVGRQQHRIECNWKLLVDAFNEVYHVRTVHPDNAALLYDDRTVTVAMLANGHSRLSVAKKPEMVPLTVPGPDADNPSVGSLWRETSTSFGIFPNLVVPMDAGAFSWICMWPIDVRTTELELVWFAPDWGEGEPSAEHTMRMELFETVMAQDTANMNAIQSSVESRGARPFRIGWHERLIHHFHRAVDLAIGDELPADCAVSTALDGFVEAG